MWGDIELKKNGANPTAGNDKVQLDETSKRFLIALRELDDAWVSIFRETGFSDIYFFPVVYRIMVERRKCRPQD